MTKNNNFNLISVIPTYSKNEGHDQPQRWSRLYRTINCSINNKFYFNAQTCFALSFCRSYHSEHKNKELIREYYLERRPIDKIYKRIWKLYNNIHAFKLLKSLPPINNHKEFLVTYLNLEQLTFILLKIKNLKKNDYDGIMLARIWNPEYSAFFKNKPAIYLIQNKITKKNYIGKSNNLHDRLANYCNVSYLFNKRASSNIYRAILKFGYQNFSFTILEHCEEKDLNKREQYYIDIIKPQYNIRKIVHSDKKKNM